MKKFLLILIIVAGASALKAQQLSLKSTDTLLFRSPKNFKWPDLKLGDNAPFEGFSKLPKGEPSADMPDFGSKSAEVFFSRMPVAKLYSEDRMPVARLDGIDKMPIKGLKVLAPLVKPYKGVSP